MSSYGYRDAQGGYGRIRRPPVRPAITAPRSPNNRAGPFGVTPLGLSTRTAAKPVFGDPVNGALSAGAQARAGIGVGGANPITHPTPQPPTATAPQHQPAAPNAPVAPELSYDYSADPILNQIKALSSKQRTDAQGTALMLRKQTAIDYGDPDVAGQFGDQSTIDAAKNNPFSVRAQLKKGYDTGVGQLEEGYNQSNLFYGGARAKGLADFADQYQGKLYGAGIEERGILQGIGDNLTTALGAADLQDIQGQGPAADRAIQNAINTGVDPGAAAPITPDDVTQYLDPYIDPYIDPTPLGGNAADIAPLPVGATNNPLIYALLGRKMDPRFDF